jgi:Kdo2-lipid IVA lauroyltransferase/acyltransferase
MTRIFLFFMWLMHFLPLPVIEAVGRFIGGLAYYFGRRKVTRTNLALCFPEKSVAERKLLAKALFKNLGGAFMQASVLWWSPPARITELCDLKGREHVDALKGQPVILLSPHFCGLDIGGARVGYEWQLVSMYSEQKNQVFDRLLLGGRKRFGNPHLVTRSQGLRSVVKYLKQGFPFLYLPDMDFGPRDSVFVPFFGVPTATITALTRLCQMTGAKVIPSITKRVDGKYQTTLYPAWDNFPGASLEDDAARMNQFIEDRVREAPEQYFFVHKRFKTRPPGEPPLY